MELGMNRVNLEEVFTWESPCFSTFPRLQIGSTYLVLTGTIYSPCSFLHPVLSRYKLSFGGRIWRWPSSGMVVLDIGSYSEMLNNGGRRK